MGPLYSPGNRTLWTACSLRGPFEFRRLWGRWCATADRQKGVDYTCSFESIVALLPIWLPVPVLVTVVSRQRLRPSKLECYLLRFRLSQLRLTASYDALAADDLGRWTPVFSSINPLVSFGLQELDDALAQGKSEAYPGGTLLDWEVRNHHSQWWWGRQRVGGGKLGARRGHWSL
jgi:hypothetical protein